MKNKSQSQSAPEQAGNVNSPVVWMYEYYGLQNEWCSEEHWYQCVGTIKPMEGEFIRHIIPLYVYAIPEGYCIVPIEPSEISTDAVEAAGRCTACGDELI